MRPTTLPDCPCPMPALPRTQRRRALAAALLLALAPCAANAATIVVTSPDDTAPTAADTCTLRQAVVSMNTGALAGNCTVSNGEDFGVHDTVAFAASALTGANPSGTITLADSADASGTLGGTLVVTADALTIDGTEWRGTGPDRYPDGVTIARPDGATHKFGILRDTAPAGGRLALKGVAIRNGDAFEPLCDGRREGGGVCIVAADLSMTDSRVSGNQAANGGGGIASFAGTLTLTRCLLDGNVAYLGGGLHSGFGAATVTASTIDGNGEWAGSHGGGIRADGALVVADSTISNNAGKRGAGLQAGGTLTLIRSMVAGNQSYYHGGGIHVLAGSVATVTGSTIDHNSARYNGAGLYVEGVLTAANSTITGNSGYRDGGGIALSGGGTLHLDHATVTRNGVGGTGGGIGYDTWTGAAWTGSATIDHSIVSGNTQGSGTDVNLGGAWSGSGNLISSPDVALGPLQDNGGPTPTMLPGPGSAAIDAIAPQDCTQAADQRGVARPFGAGCDVGAVEVVVDLIFADGFDGEPPAAHEGAS